jgi:predicted P-loop ATPase
MMDFSTDAPAAWDNLRERAQAAQDAQAQARQKLIEDVEMLGESAPSVTIEALVKAMHGCSMPDLDAQRTLKVMAKRTGATVGSLRDLHDRLRPPPIRRTYDVTEIATLEPGPDLWNALDLDQNDAGTQVLDNLNNARKVLESDKRLIGRVWFDEFANRIRTNLRFDAMMDFAPGPGREWADVDDLHLMQHMQDRIGMAYVRIDTVAQAVRVVAMRNRINPPRDWMDGLVWDGVERLGAALHEGFGAEQDEYTAAVGRCFFVSIAARVYQPGCKVDTVPVFEGAQGLGKSRALRIIGGSDWYAECHEQVTSKDFYLVLDGKMLVELSEMQAFSRAEVTRIKGVVSCQIDRYRAPYERHASDHPRRTVLAGTTNRDDWNTDETGARRFWPIACTRVNQGWLSEHREQLFAEAAARFRRGEAWWDVPEAAAQAAQAARRPDDVWTAVVARYVETGERPGVGVSLESAWKRGEATIPDILASAIGIVRKDQGKVEEMRVSAILTGLGWRRVLRGPPTARFRCWIPATTTT